jgi:hypothetical protein
MMTPREVYLKLWTAWVSHVCVPLSFEDITETIKDVAITAKGSRSQLYGGGFSFLLHEGMTEYGVYSESYSPINRTYCWLNGIQPPDAVLVELVLRMSE